jgi:hypothetical protein
VRVLRVYTHEGAEPLELLLQRLIALLELRQLPVSQIGRLLNTQLPLILLCEKRPLVSQRFLCLSRACLGKMIFFSILCSTKGVSRTYCPLRVLDLAPAVRELPQHRLRLGVALLQRDLLQLQLDQLGLDRDEALGRQGVQPLLRTQRRCFHLQLEPTCM